MTGFLLNVESPAGCLKGKISPAEELLTEVIHHRYSSQVTEARSQSHLPPPMSTGEIWIDCAQVAMGNQVP